MGGMNTLSQYLADHGVTQSEFAERVGVKQPTISRLLKPRGRPGVDLAIAIERETGGKVPALSWFAMRGGVE